MLLLFQAPSVPATLTGAAAGTVLAVGALTTGPPPGVLMGAAVITILGVGALSTPAALRGVAVGTALAVGALTTVWSYTLGPTLPTRTVRAIPAPHHGAAIASASGGAGVMADLKLVEGHTGVIDEILTSNGTALNLTGMTVELVLQTANGTLVNTAADVTVPTPAAGLVRYTPDPADLLARETPHVARWKVTDGAGAIVFFPSDAGEVWEVQPSGPLVLQDNALLTLAELKAYLQITGNEQDLAVATFINGVSDAVETLTGRRLVRRTYTNEYLVVAEGSVHGMDWLDVEWPITALTALTIGGTTQSIWMPGDLGTPWDADCFVPGARDPKHGQDRISRPGGWPLGALVQRTYTAGYSDAPPATFPIPGDLKQAVQKLAGEWYYSRSRQSEPVISRSSGAETITYVNDALPRTFPTLVNSYRRWR